MNRVVLDSSVTVKFLNQIDEDLTAQADKILVDAQQGKVSLVSPELSKYEIGNALLKKKLKASHAHEALEILYQLPISFIPESQELSKKTYQIANQFGITYYDAAFVALAKELDARLITDNYKHQGKVKTSKIVALKDY